MTGLRYEQDAIERAESYGEAAKQAVARKAFGQGVVYNRCAADCLERAAAFEDDPGVRQSLISQVALFNKAADTAYRSATRKGQMQ